MLFEKLLLNPINLMKTKNKQMKANIMSGKFHPNLYGKKNSNYAFFYELPFSDLIFCKH
jgi:hypothetical protein